MIEDDWMPLAISGGFAGVCGGVSYWLKVVEGKAFRWSEFAVHLAVSALCGLISFPLLQSIGLDASVCGALCGMAGWMGTRLIRIGEVVVAKRLGVSKEDLE